MPQNFILPNKQTIQHMLDFVCTKKNPLAEIVADMQVEHIYL